MRKDGDIYWEFPDTTHIWTDESARSKSDMITFNQGQRIGTYLSDKKREKFLHYLYAKEKPIKERGLPFSFEEFKELYKNLI